MSKPLNTVFLDEIEARLSNITSLNGYFDELKKIKRATLEPFKGYDLPSCNFWTTSLDNQVDTYHGDKRSLNLLVETHTLTRDLPFIDVCDQLGADLVTALNRSTTNPKASDVISIDLGGLVDDFAFAGYDYLIGQGQKPWCGILAKFTINFNADISIMS